MVEEKPKMDPKAKSILILFALLVIGILLGLVITRVGLNLIEDDFKERYDLVKEAAQRRSGGNVNVENYLNKIEKNSWENFSEKYTMVTLFICINIVLLLSLIYYYMVSFSQTKSSFMLGILMIFGVLFMQSLLSLPLIQSVFDQSVFDLGLIHVFPNMFETIALIIFFYLGTE